MSYVDFEYYSRTYGGKIITAEEAPKLLQNASDAVDTLTYCRIVSRGFAALTEFQRGIIQRVVCALAEWQSENADILDNPFDSYSINGVAVSWGKSVGVKTVNGVMIPNSIYSELVKTGLCYRGV
jgi:hypothetical protein